jgi:hypothetical protein
MGLDIVVGPAHELPIEEVVNELERIEAGYSFRAVAPVRTAVTPRTEQALEAIEECHIDSEM